MCETAKNIQYLTVLDPAHSMVRFISPGDDTAVSRFSSFVREHPNSHFLQLPCWASVKEKWDWRGIAVYRGGKMTGAMSVLIRRLPLGCCLFYAPRGPVCDRNDESILSLLLQGAKELARQEKAVLLFADPDEPDTNGEFRSIMEHLGFRERQSDDFGNIQAQHVMRLSLSGRTEAEIFENFCPKTRYNIRLAQRKGVQIRKFSGGAVPEEALDSFTVLMEATGKRDHFCIRNRDYFSRVFTAFGTDAVLFMAYLEGKPIAGTIGIFSGGKGWYLYGASANEHRNAMPNYLLQWEMLRHSLALRCRFYDFRGVPGNPSQSDPLYGLYRFKKGFSGDYLKLTGLFTYPFRPVLARCALLLLKCRGRLRGTCAHP